MTQDILCITAGQRSGTTALRSLISGCDRFADLGEIFDTATIDQPESFFGFCRDRRIQISDVLSGPDAEKLCREFIAVLRKKAANRHLLFDVKLNSWGEIRMPWTFMHQEPFFLNQLKWRSAKIIFVWRRDIVGQILSDRISDRIGKWHNLVAGDLTPPFSLDVEKIRLRAKLLCQSERFFFETLRSYPNTLMLCYERLFDAAGNLDASIGQQISGLMGESYVFPMNGHYKKNQIDKTRILVNYTELAAAITEVAAKHREPLLFSDRLPD